MRNVNARTRSRHAPVTAFALVGTLLVARASPAESGSSQPLAGTPEPAAPAPASIATSPPPVSAPGAPAAGTLADQRTQVAAALFREAETHYANDDIEGALGLMRESYRLSEKPELLFNLGQLERQLKQCSAARRDYTEYLERVKDGSHREQAQQFAQELALECPGPVTSPAVTGLRAPATTPATAPAAPPPPAPDYWTPLRIAGWSTLGAAVATGTAATYFAFHAASCERRIEQHIQDGSYTLADDELMDEGQRSTTWARVLGVGTASFTIVGVSLLWWQHAKSSSASGHLAVSLSAVGANAVYRGSF